MEKRFRDTREAAEFTGFSARTLEHKRFDGTGPRFRRVGRKILYDVQDLLDWIESVPAVTSTAAADAAEFGGVA